MNSLGQPGRIEPDKSMTSSEVVELMKENLTCSWAIKTVDTIKAGDPDQEIGGIACNFMATVDVLKKAPAGRRYQTSGHW